MEALYLCNKTFRKTHLLLVVFFSLQLSTSKALQECEAQILSFEGDRELIATGQSVTYTCVVSTGRTEWKFGDSRSITLNSFTHSGTITPENGITVNISGYTNEEGHYVSTLEFPPSAVLALNDTDVVCAVKPGEFKTACGDQLKRIKAFSAPGPPGSVQVVSERDLEVTLTWDAAFLPFNITPQYKVYVDGELEATVDQPVFTLSRAEPGCQPHRIVVVAFNEVGNSSAQPVNVTLPSVPELGGLVQSVSSHISKSSGQASIKISFEQARSCDSHPVGNYSVLVLSNGSSIPTTRVVQAPPTLGEVVTVTVEGLAENTLYTYQITAHNTIGSTTTEPTPFYTTDVTKVTAMEMKQGALFLSCEFVPGTNALGCQVKLETFTRLGNLTHTLYRGPEDTAVNETIVISTNLSCYHQVLVFDVESDNTTSALGRPGSIEANQSRPCTAPIRAQDSSLPLPVIIGISMAVPVVVISVCIIIVVCCLVRKSSLCKGSSVKDKHVWVNTGYINPAELMGNRVEAPSDGVTQENKLPLYDSVHSFRPTSSESGGSASQDYQLLRRDLGRSQPMPPSPHEVDTDSQDYARLNPEPYEVPAYAEPYEYHDPLYQTVADSTTRRTPQTTPPTHSPPAYYSEVADALPSNKRTKPIGRSSTLTLPQQGNSNLSQV